MSAARPPLGKRPAGEASCRGAPSAERQLPEALTLDEFTAPEDRQEELRCVRPRVEQLFRVVFTIIGLLDPSPAHGSRAARLIWVQLRGKRADVARAKEYVKGLCNPELQEKESYPPDMHCIFVGARGLFLDCLVQDTSAEVQVPETGSLRILGSAEAVVMAQSQVQQFVKLFREKSTLPADKDSLVKRRFKSFVEAQADKYAMELLLLPSSLKEELLNLAHSATPPSPPDTTDARWQSAPHCSRQAEQERAQASTPVTELSNRILDTSFEERTVSQEPVAGTVLNCRPSCKRRSSGSEDRDTKRQFSEESREDGEDADDDCYVLGDQSEGAAIVVLDSSDQSDDPEVVSPETNFKCLVNFFKTMGYPQELVERVIQETGQGADTFVLLEQIVAESQRAQAAQAASSPNNPCGSPELTSQQERGGSAPHKPRERVQGGNGSNPNVLMEWKSKENIQPSSNSIGPRNLSGGGAPQGPAAKRSGAQPGPHAPGARKAEDVEPDSARSETDFLPRGSGQAFRPVRVESVTPLRSAAQPSVRPEPVWPGHDPPARPPERPPPSARPSTSCAALAVFPLTGAERFQQSLKTPYKLGLQNEPGRPGLRHVIIDGSNVAMTHGLHRFFSCRGIAIAVESFWKRGHRDITVFVPQWRMKKDPLTTEQHFLTQLEALRLLSFTPAREVCGQRIASHDDRFLLHLAERTGGIIVTNDNLKEFVSMSESWKEIIKKRLLQFTFVEDYFMIPDDPLGKNGPRLEEFLSKDFRSLAAERGGQGGRAPPRGCMQAVPQAASFFLCSQPQRDPHPEPPAPPQRSVSETVELKRQLYDIFPDQKQRIDQILSDNPYMRDLNALSGLLLG
ncbi:NEDD4-binding protein 1 isoform X2 [Lepisosteus oculatus]|uniref:NEDD4-binding protein 1 isoform X2 n=1 Tax=Lepisosteus oculatus TaxID=7918 RepID=UPI0035F51A36